MISLKNLKRAGMLAVMGCFFLMGVAFAADKPSTGINISSILPNIYEEKVLNWSFRYPANWKVQDDDVVPGDLDLSEVKEVSVVVIRQDKDGEYHASHSIMVTYFSDMTAKDADSRKLSDLGKIIPYANSNPNRGLQYAVEKEKDEGIFKQYVVTSSKGVILITTIFANKEEMAESQPEIEKIAMSIQVK